jgi:hypothetical protein
LKAKKEPPKKGGIENDKEDQLLRLEASLIVQTVLSNCSNGPDKAGGR